MNNGRELNEPAPTGKTCSKCDTWKPLDEFYDGTAQHGKHRWCKVCFLKYAKERHARIRGRDYKPRKPKSEQEVKFPDGHEYPADSIFRKWPRDENGRLLNYWRLEEL